MIAADLFLGESHIFFSGTGKRAKSVNPPHRKNNGCRFGSAESAH